MTRILFITLSNIGDVILTLPALDCLISSYPQAEVTVMCGPRPQEIFQHNPAIFRLIVYDKHAPLSAKIRLFNELNRCNFDIVVDLRNTLFGAFLKAGKRNSPFLRVPGEIKHARKLHIFKVRHLTHTGNALGARKSFSISSASREYAVKILSDSGISADRPFLAIAPGARSSTKRWDKDKFADMISKIPADLFEKVVLVGDNDDVLICAELAQGKAKVLNLAGKTTLTQLAALLSQAALLITNDSATMHMASYLNTPVIALFGPTDAWRYGPWADKSIILRRHLFCAPCMKAQCRYGTLQCLKLITVQNVLEAIERMRRDSGHQTPDTSHQGTMPQTANRKPQSSEPGDQSSFRRILICRTDKIGDVVLSTPIFKAVRQAFPNAYIAVMVQPYTAPLVEDNPYIDDVIIMEKKGFWWTLGLTRSIRAKRFDLAIILHTTSRVKLIVFFAGIIQRIGYARKSGWLLTDKLPYVKPEGRKHEMEYSFDLLKLIGIESPEKEILVTVKKEVMARIAKMLRDKGVSLNDKLVIIHPSASCPSRIWPGERFAELARSLLNIPGVRLGLIADKKDKPIADWICANINGDVLNFAGLHSLSETIAVLKQASLLVSNDSGPVHIASAVGTPAIAIFGRKQPGLSPRRWGPVGKRDQFIHKDAGCVQCLAHNCVRGFACLKAITVPEVEALAKNILLAK